MRTVLDTSWCDPEPLRVCLLFRVQFHLSSKVSIVKSSAPKLHDAAAAVAAAAAAAAAERIDVKLQYASTYAAIEI